MNVSEIIVNPFLNLLNDDSDNINKIYEEYKEVFIICCKNNETVGKEIYQYYIDKQVLSDVKKKLFLIKTNVNILNNINHKNKVLLLPESLLKEINIFNYKLCEKNIALMILNIDYDNLLLYISQFESNNNLEELFKFLTINLYFKGNVTNVKTYKKINSLINFEDSDYWTYSYKCKMDLTEYFTNRKFNLSSTVMKEIGCYLNEIHKTKNYTDPSKLLLSGNFKYKVFNEKNIKKEDINELFGILDDKQRYFLFCNLIVSKRYCHLALNNIYLLRLMKDTMVKYAELFRYLIGYAWIRFYFDESIKKSYISKNDDFIFDINTASELPNYPFLSSNPKLNPYMPILISDNQLDPHNNIGGVTDYIENPTPTNNGICNLEEFKTRLNIFCTNNPKHNIFEHVDFDKDNIAISGSVMAACLQRSHPLLALFNKITNYETRLARFYNEYYALADIDIMFLTDDIFDYMSKVQRFYNQIVVNVCTLYPEYAEPSHVKLVSDKIAYLFVNDEKALKLCNNSVETLDRIKKSLEEPATKKLFEPLFQQELVKFKKDRISKMSQEEINHFSLVYPDYFDFENINWRIRFTKEKNDNDINMLINYKYHIKSPHITHNLELFNVKYNDFFSTIQSFHLPCVRSYYDGNNVYLTPSCISAHLTYMNIDYKYFSGARDPVDIINKYRMRGFGTWLNNDEKIILLRYSKHNPFWNNLYNIVDDNMKPIQGFLSVNNKLFHPRMFNIDSYYDAFPIDWTEPYIVQKESKKLDNVNDYFLELSNRYKTRLLFPFLNDMQTIGINGSIKKLNKWVIEGCWNIMQNTIKKEKTKGNILEATKIKKRNTYFYDISGSYNTFNDKTNLVINEPSITIASNNQILETTSGPILDTTLDTSSGPILDTSSGPILDTLSGPILDTSSGLIKEQLNIMSENLNKASDIASILNNPSLTNEINTLGKMIADLIVPPVTKTTEPVLTKTTQKPSIPNLTPILPKNIEPIIDINDYEFDSDLDEDEDEDD